ncbi:MAG: lytic transglycosylase domain-containing protein [Pseudomonadota bacterium]|nr:lytic transglycosylase domain-containing protein [Pseudomonadota bacterium]
MKISLFMVALGLAAAPAAAQERDPLAPIGDEPEAPAQRPDDPPSPTSAPAVAAPLPAFVQPAPKPVVVPTNWRGVFTAIRRREWGSAAAGIDYLPRGPLSAVARAELYTAKGSPAVDLGRIQSLLAEAPDLPHAEQLARLAVARGAIEPPAVVPRRRIVGLGSAPRRQRARPVSGEALANQLRSALDPLIKNNLATDAEALLIQQGPYLSTEARAEAGQRVAWVYYVLGRDLDARRLADSWRAGAAGEWAPHAAWISGLASWRLNDCEAASRSFREVAATSRDRELSAAGYYWAARSEQACRRPRAVAPLLKLAARNVESFYGLVARETLGAPTRLPPDPHSFASQVENLPNVRRAVELVNIGERALGEEMLRHQSKIGLASQHHGLIEFAKRLDLAGAQFWLAHNGQRGAVADASDRYPMPRWMPLQGWRIDPALALAHARQESNFRIEVVSPAGAIGLMQVRPGTASDMARRRNIPFAQSNVVDPILNLEYGQSFIELMRSSGATRGQLPRVIAAYNAGPLPVGRWLNIHDKGDPLLWMESITYWETRYYVPAVLRNMWIYQGMQNARTPTLKAIAEHHWPAFPAQPAR